MDSERFDAVIRAWTVGTPRRTALSLLAGGLAGLASLEVPETTAKKKKVTLCINGQTKLVKKSKKAQYLSQGATQGACASSPPSPPPPPPVATCTDGVKNGAETDMDCGGGTCDKCPINKRCVVDFDCFSANCSGGQCAVCKFDADCPAGCFCDGEVNCYNKDELAAVTLQTNDCEACPPRTAVCFSPAPGTVRCRPFCGETYF